MKCSHCGANLPDNVNYCTKCGNAVARSYADNTSEAETSVLNRESNPYNQGNDFFDEKTTTVSGGYDNRQQYNTPPQNLNQPEYYTPPQPSANYYNMQSTNNEPVTIGGWIGVFFLSVLPLVNLIMLFVWAFSSSTKQSLKNYARAVLILSLIGTILIVVLIVIMAIAGITIPIKYR